jgi:hypothetical protein
MSAMHHVYRTADTPPPDRLVLVRRKEIDIAVLIVLLEIIITSTNLQ